MALLRICIEKDPDISKPIIQEILRLDREISDLTAKLVTEQTGLTSFGTCDEIYTTFQNLQGTPKWQ